MKIIIALTLILVSTTMSFAAEPPKSEVRETVTTKSGLQYTSLKEGTGATPGPTSTVRVNYRGKLLNGREFDSSYKNGGPAEFQLNQVIKCWTEGLQMMKVGGKAELYCPANIAYGDNGIPGSIPPFASLTFEVELVDNK
jgi:FKBP-type peptidyl-prolyl cis-trans isomerase FkpA